MGLSESLYAAKGASALVHTIGAPGFPRIIPFFTTLPFTLAAAVTSLATVSFVTLPFGIATSMMSPSALSTVTSFGVAKLVVGGSVVEKRQ